MVSDPWRAGPGLSLTTKVTLPGPLPPASEVMVIHESLLVASHEASGQFAGANTSTPASPPRWSKWWLTTDNDRRQVGTEQSGDCSGLRTEKNPVANSAD